MVLTIDRVSWIIIALVGALLLSVWALLNRPQQAPVWPATIQGIAFSPFHANQSPERLNRYPTEQQIANDLALLAGKTTQVRTYSVESTLGSIPTLADQFGLDVLLGLWISNDLARNQREIDRLRTLLKTAPDNITGIVVGNEVLLRQELQPQVLADYVDTVKQFSNGIPVTVAETWEIWLDNKALAQHVDLITAHVLPYWEGIPAWHAPDYIFERYAQLQQAFSDKTVVLGEVGWPSEGRQRFAAEPSLHNQATVLRQFLDRAEREGADYFVLEAFDQVWKTNEGSVGRYWGIFNAEREAKFPFAAPITPIPEWRAIAGVTLAFAVLLLALLLRDSQGLAYSGRSFLVLVSFTISTAVVWIIYDHTRKYMTWEQVLVGLALLSAAACISIVLLTEAHEWAETLWNRRRDHQAPLTQPGDDQHSQPMVSIHVATYNEPPDMVIATLSALQALNYPHYEVIIVDNNTKDSAVWQPVEQWCAAHAEHFRFYHVSPLSGFKAGALNYALERTSTKAELIAVIDSDYIVDPGWLRTCCKLFEDPETAIVQAPQDYRDANQSVFKSMIYAEYAGFFRIGMVNRNARNAIIQHGTMTLVRRTALQHNNGWSCWCITEDAELGLRLLEQGYRAIYTPESHGRGLMPDTFLDYKKQRFRWAYGSVLILRHHRHYFLKLNRSSLTAGQRYHFLAGWLPWMADGLCLVFNCVALMYSVLMILYPQTYAPPEVMLSLLPVSLFVFKLTKMLVLYRWRLHANLIQSLCAALAGLALSHTIARAVLAGLYTQRIGFVRTPKMVNRHGVIQALFDTREETLLAAGLLLSAVTLSFRDDAYLSDTRLWIVLLIAQSIPYLASITLSLISTLNPAAERLNDAAKPMLIEPAGTSVNPAPSTEHV